MLSMEEIAKLFKLNHKELNLEIIKLNNLYRTGKPIVSDSDFDQLETHLKELDPQASYFKELKSIETTKEVKLTMQMLSLDKAVNEKEVELAMKKERFKDKTIIFSEKIDGLSLELTYERKNNSYSLTKAATRGDGTIGQDVTESIKGFADCIPKALIVHYEDFTTLLIRGELYLEKSSLNELNAYMESEGLTQFKNTRNSVPAALSTKKNARFLKYMSFKAFSSKKI